MKNPMKRSLKAVSSLATFSKGVQKLSILKTSRQSQNYTALSKLSKEMGSPRSYPNNVLASIKEKSLGSTVSSRTIPQQGKHMSPEAVLHYYKSHLTEFEQLEILSYKEIYFLGFKNNRVFRFTGEDGEYLAGKKDHVAYRYEINQLVGEGTFSQVFSAFDHKTREFVALKIVKNQHRFKELALRELEFLKTLNKAYGEVSYTVKLRNSFTFRSHQVFVFELLEKSMFEVLQLANFQGLPLKQVSQLGYQVLLGLSQLHAKQIIHCDLKPENIIFTSKSHDRIKLIDLGTACYSQKPLFCYIQSRFYRAPEVILGAKYSAAIDMWSFGCVLAEIVTGMPVFMGENEHSQLLCIMEYKGYPPAPLLAKAVRATEFFTETHSVVSREDSTEQVRRPGARSLGALLGHCGPVFLHLVQACLQWEPEKRITAQEALAHPFFSKGTQLSPKKSHMRKVLSSSRSLFRKKDLSRRLFK